MRPRISIRGSVRPSVGPSVRPWVRRSVTRFSNIAEMETWGLWDIRELPDSNKFMKIHENSFILTFIGRIFVRIELVSLTIDTYWKSSYKKLLNTVLRWFLAQLVEERKGLNGWSFDKILGLLISLPVWKRHFRTTSGRKPPSSVDVLKLRLPHPRHNQLGSNYSLNLANNCTGSRINTEIVAKKWRKNMVLTHVAFDARGRGLAIFFWYQHIHLWKEQTKTNRMPGWNAL